MRAQNYSKKQKRALARLLKHDVNEIIADQPWGYRRRARLSLSYQPKTAAGDGFSQGGLQRYR
jgi:tRNA/tmRNA/rRNA uracil-C5-methylase (TrmA/RlmC/RlmD family)